ncbi:cytochrome C-type biogenesis protein [Sorangium cellulosum]|jgi:cytochrome c-type biogenesis protein CcmH/NrfF|uniref:Cytochrome c-type biogenesis protein n=1 Tax=Sorangium cellulosum TaxID=56 RepID=A0A4P2QCE2_SORCE|nr:cytochrome c-type biogenesis protein CcmH [Sorangium cellulosum]AUX26986.1 cytochrome C-type biogenesis protein [Sorangium cellulosum]
MSRTRTLIHGITLLAAGLVALVVLLRSPDFAHGQQLGEGMVRTGTVGIQSDAERKLFWSVICTCGCPRETLGTCTCGFAHERRSELRAALAAGLSLEEIQAAYVERFGPEALAVPPNKGSQRLLYLFPLGAIVLGAGLVIVTLRRWKRRSDEAGGGGQGSAKDVAAGARDDYDDKLDEELKSLDREDRE